ncbi:MAG TPA: metalloregulator ArsR/SmtB family transcription factor [Microbacteriaceae bacterium]|nr:metalloregulator ArsR/SmtB family transcription factor [Microbacteriaceae bacterium]
MDSIGENGADVGDRQLKSEMFDQLASVGKALANGKRLELLELLAQGERGVDALAQAAGLGLSTASAHLQLLRRAGLVVTRREGTSIHYRLAGWDVARLLQSLCTIAESHAPAVEKARAAYLNTRPHPAHDAPEISRQELMNMADDAAVTVLDVRPEEEYAAAHIPGALSIPVEELAARIAEVPAGRQVVAYCRGAYCVLAYEAADTLHAAGRPARRLHGGMLEWRANDLPTESSAA